MKLGTQIRFANGAEATVVFNSLIGVGVKWGLHDPDPKEFEGTHGGLFGEEASLPVGWQWEPEALLRDPWPGCERCGFVPEQCVGNDYEVTRPGVDF